MQLYCYWLVKTEHSSENKLGIWLSNQIKTIRSGNSFTIFSSWVILDLVGLSRWLGYMHRDLVESRKWISEDEYKEGLALAQLAPGPLAAQLGIYLGYVHYGILGASLCGMAFIIPSFIMVVLIGIADKIYGGLPWMQAVFYGVGTTVIGIIAMSSYKLTIKSVGKINLQSVRQNWLLWVFYILGVAITVIT